MKLNELFVNTFDKELDAPEYLIIAGLKTIYFVENDNTDDTKEQLIQIADLEQLKIDYEDIDIYYFHTTINETYPNIFSVTWKLDSDTIEHIVPSLNHNIDIRISKHFIDVLKTLKNKLNVEWIEVYETSLNNKGSETDHTETYELESLIKNFEKDLRYKKIPKEVYHGTSTEYLSKILKLGLVGFQSAEIEKPNFDKIHHTRTFLTSNKIDAFFYANNSAELTNSFPIILEIDTDGIDINQIGYDYDFYNDYIGGEADEEFDEIRMMATMRNPYHREKNEEELTLKHLRDKYIGATYRKFSYNGRIMPKWIINIYYNESSDETKFEESIEPSEYPEFLEMVQYYADNYWYQDGDYVLNMDAYREMIEEEQEEENEKINIDMENIEMIKFSESVSPNRLEVYFDNIQDIMKAKLVKDPFNIPPDEVEKYLDSAITNTVINQLKIKEFVVTEHERGSSEEQVADMILSQQKEGLGKNDIFKKKNVNDKNGIYTDQPVPNALMGEMVTFRKFNKK